MLTTLSDGSIQDPDGKLVHLGVARFIRDVCEGSCCFVCGQQSDPDKTNDEHAVPDWIQKRYGLHGKEVVLPNATSFKYGQYKIPCCVDCNALMGRTFEKPIRELVDRGVNAVSEHLEANGPGLIFSWLALIYVKTHLKDRQLRADRDMRLPAVPISARYEWETLHQVYTVARAFYTGSVVSPEAMGSLFVIPTAVERGRPMFDLVDLYQARSIMLRMDDICMVAVLDDSCAAFGALRHALSRITAPLTALQAREFLAHAAFSNLMVDPRPEFFVREVDERVILGAVVPEKLSFRSHTSEEFGELLHHCCQHVFVDERGSSVDLPVDLRGGRASFLFDGDRFLPRGGELSPRESADDDSS